MNQVNSPIRNAVPFGVAAMRQRLGRTPQIVVAALVIIAVAAYLVVRALPAAPATPSTAAQTATAFASAMSRGDAAAVAGTASLNLGGEHPDLQLTDAHALGAVLKTYAPAERKTTAGPVRTTSDPSAASVTFGVGTQQVTLQMANYVVPIAGGKPRWAVVLRPTYLSASLPGSASDMTVDGQPLHLKPATPALVALLPFAHRIGLLGTTVIQPATATIPSFVSGRQELTFALTDAGNTAAAKAGLDAVTGCNNGSLKSDVCRIFFPGINRTDDKFTLVGTPTVASTSASPDGFSVAGHYQAIESWSTRGATAHAVAASPFVAVGTISSGGVFTVTRVQNGPPAGNLTRPAAATDDLARQAVGPAMAACGRATTASPVDCPQFLSQPLPSNPHWHLAGDPTPGATVTYDANTGAFAVSGPFSMTCDFTLNGSPHTDPSATKNFRADLLWDGQKFLLVTIGGSF